MSTDPHSGSASSRCASCDRVSLHAVVPSIAHLIRESPGFEKKNLSQFKLDLLGLCGFGCVYCSSNQGNYLRTRRKGDEMPVHLPGAMLAVRAGRGL